MNKKGFTLVELLAVIAIIAILGTMGVAAVLKIYNNNINKTMVVQENNIAEASKTYLEDYCIDPIDNTYKCPDSYKNNESIFIADDKKSFAATIESMKNIELRTIVGNNCRQIYEKMYSPEAISSLIIEAIEK